MSAIIWTSRSRPGKERAFFTALLDKLKQDSITELCLESLRHDSTVMTYLVDLAKGRGYKVTVTKENVSLDLDLPSTWDEYLRTLSPKQRRETGRRFRRLEEEGDINYRTVESAEPEALDIFFKLMRVSRKDKAAFMTPQMESFFRAIADTMAEAKMLRFGILEISAKPVAAVMCFDYNDKVYLYNSGYDPEYSYSERGAALQAALHQGQHREGQEVLRFSERGRRNISTVSGVGRYRYYSCSIILT